MSINYATLLADLFVYSYYAEYLQKTKRKLSHKVNLSFRHIGVVLSQNNQYFSDCLHFDISE